MLKPRGVGWIRLTCGSKRLYSHRLINHLHGCWNRRFLSGSKRAYELSTSVSTFSPSERANPICVNRRVDGVGNLITRVVMFYSDCTSRSKISSFKLHWSFFHSLSLLVTDLSRRLTVDFRSWSLEISHGLLFGEFHPRH